MTALRHEHKTARRLSLAHPLKGSRAPWTAEWSAGRTDASPLSPWFRLRATTRVGFALALFADPDADRRAELAALRVEGPRHG